MKLFITRETGYELIINCGQINLNNQLASKSHVPYSEQELVRCITCDTAGILHFTGCTKRKAPGSSEVDYVLPV